VRIATFNVNGVNGRLPRLREWLTKRHPTLRASGVDAEQRGREKPSDHAPVWVEFAL